MFSKTLTWEVESFCQVTKLSLIRWYPIGKLRTSRVLNSIDGDLSTLTRNFARLWLLNYLTVLFDLQPEIYFRKQFYSWFASGKDILSQRWMFVHSRVIKKVNWFWWDTNRFFPEDPISWTGLPLVRKKIRWRIFTPGRGICFANFSYSITI